MTELAKDVPVKGLEELIAIAEAVGSKVDSTFRLSEWEKHLLTIAYEKGYQDAIATKK